MNYFARGRRAQDSADPHSAVNQTASQGTIYMTDHGAG